jgi:16S rRNA (cytidine1402-2'-O)-methyltransferase
VAALTASGLPTDAFLYLGYLPRKISERRELVTQVSNLRYTLIFLEAPHRLLDSLADLESILGERPIAIARELTKLHEQIWRGTLHEACAYFTRHEPRGEFTLVIGGQEPAPREVEKWSGAHMMSALLAGAEAGETPSKLAARLAAESGWSRREVYKLATLVKSRTS